MKLKEIKTSGYWVYAHITPEKEVYIGMSKMQPYQRWNPSHYKGMALEPYIERFGWKNIEHLVIQDGLTKEQALKLEDWFITKATKDGFCINKRRSGLIKVSDEKAYDKQRYAEHQEERKQYNKQRRETPEGRIYDRVKAYNQNHTPIETPLEARDKYLSDGYIPTYIKNDDLQ